MTQEFHSERYFYKTPHAQKGYRDVSPTQIYHIRSVIPGIKMSFFWPTYSNCAHHVLYLSTDISSGYLTRTKASKSKRRTLMQCWCLIYLIQLFRREKIPIISFKPNFFWSNTQTKFLHHIYMSNLLAALNILSFWHLKILFYLFIK